MIGAIFAVARKFTAATAERWIAAWRAQGIQHTSITMGATPFADGEWLVNDDNSLGGFALPKVKED